MSDREDIANRRMTPRAPSLGLAWVALWPVLCLSIGTGRQAEAAGSAPCAQTLQADVDRLLRLRDGEAEAKGNSGVDPEERARFGLAMIMNDFYMYSSDRSHAAKLPETLRNLPAAELRKRRESGVVDGTVCEIMSFMRSYYAGDSEGPATASASASAPAAAPARPPAAAAPAPAPKIASREITPTPRPVATAPAAETRAPRPRERAAEREEAPARPAPVREPAAPKSAPALASESAAADSSPREGDTMRELVERVAREAAKREAATQMAIRQAADKAAAEETRRQLDIRKAAEQAAEAAAREAEAQNREADRQSAIREAAERAARAAARPPEDAAAAGPAAVSSTRVMAGPGVAAAALAPTPPAATPVESARPRSLEPAGESEPAVGAPSVQVLVLDRSGSASPEPVQPAEDPVLKKEASATLEAINQALTAPPYLSRKDLRKDGIVRTEKEMRAARKRTMDARAQLLDVLRILSEQPERQSALRRMLGPDGCSRLESRIGTLFEEGPNGEEDGKLALELWKSVAN